MHVQCGTIALRQVDSDARAALSGRALHTSIASCFTARHCGSSSAVRSHSNVLFSRLAASTSSPSAGSCSTRKVRRFSKGSRHHASTTPGRELSPAWQGERVPCQWCQSFISHPFYPCKPAHLCEIYQLLLPLPPPLLLPLLPALVPSCRLPRALAPCRV